MQTARYHKRFWNAVEDYYGTAREFARDNGIHYNTARTIMMHPERMNVRMAHSLSKKMNINVVDVIFGEGEE